MLLIQQNYVVSSANRLAATSEDYDVIIIYVIIIIRVLLCARARAFRFDFHGRMDVFMKLCCVHMFTCHLTIFRCHGWIFVCVDILLRNPLTRQWYNKTTFFFSGANRFAATNFNEFRDRTKPEKYCVVLRAPNISEDYDDLIIRASLIDWNCARARANQFFLNDCCWWMDVFMQLGCVYMFTILLVFLGVHITGAQNLSYISEDYDIVTPSARARAHQQQVFCTTMFTDGWT